MHTGRGHMAIAAQLKKVDETFTPIPKPEIEPGKIVAENGIDTLRTDRGRGSLMARLDEKGQKEITLRQSTLWFVGAVLVLAGVVFSYGTSAIGWIRDDEAGRVERSIMRKDIEEMRGEIKALTEMIRAQQLQNARTDGYKLGQTDAGASGHKQP